MVNFFELLAAYLERWGAYCREQGADMDWRSNQYELNEIAKVVRTYDHKPEVAINVLIEKNEELDEMEAVFEF